MKYEIKGGAFPIVVCNLDNGEQMITESGSMVWMSPNMKMETTGGGGLGKMFSKAISGENLFQNIYTAQGAGMITFGSSFPGRVVALEIGPGREFILQKRAFLAGEAGVQLSIHFNQKLGAGLFGGEGFIMQRLSGNGIAFAEIGGELVEYNLKSAMQTRLNWTMRPMPLTDLTKLNFTMAAKPTDKPAFYRGTLNVEKVGNTFVKLPGFTKGVVFVNGFNLGRYWNPVGPQQTLYLPGAVLKEGENEIIVFELEGTTDTRIQLLDTPELDTLKTRWNFEKQCGEVVE